MMAPTVRRTLAPRGKTPVLRITDPHGKISVIGAMALRQEPVEFSFYFHLLADNANFRGASVADFLKSLHGQLAASFTVLWDEYCIHRAQPVRDFVDATPTIQVEGFPPYAPELNPVDHVWSYVKYGRMANYCPMNLAELRAKVTEELTLVSQQPTLLKALFSRTGLPLDDDPK
jgi:hypothetical protein